MNRPWQFSLLGLLKLTALAAVVCAIGFVLLPPVWLLATETPFFRRLIGGLVVFSLLFVALVLIGAVVRIATLLVAPTDSERDGSPQ